MTAVLYSAFSGQKQHGMAHGITRHNLQAQIQSFGRFQEQYNFFFLFFFLLVNN
jgi:hypothetical protein